MKEYLNETGLWQAVEDNEIELAKEGVKGKLQIMTLNDFYRGREITAVTFEEEVPAKVTRVIGTTQAVLWHLAPEITA